MNLAVLNFLHSPVNLASPGGFGFRVASMQAVRQAANQFPDFFRGPVAGFLNDLFQCEWHEEEYTPFGVVTQREKIRSAIPLVMGNGSGSTAILGRTW